MSSHAIPSTHSDLRRAKRRTTQRWRALFSAIVLCLAGSCLNADPGHENAVSADARLTALTCHIAALYSEGRIDAATYTNLHAMRSEAARSVTIWLHSGRGEHEARAALAVWEGAVPR